MTTEITHAPVADVEVAVVETRPRGIISWGSVFAGSLIALAVMVVLSVTALAAGLELAPVRGTADPMFGATVASIITGLFIMIAFGAGGLTAVWAAGVVEPGPAILHGFLVWALALLLMLALVGVGLGSAFGSASNFLAATFEAVDIDAFERAGWGAVLALVLGAGSSVLGALLATREEISRVW